MNLLEMSFSATILILVIVIIRTLLLYKLPKKTFLVLWGVVLCRLIIPFSIPSRLSIYSAFYILKSKLYVTNIHSMRTQTYFNNIENVESIIDLSESAAINISFVFIVWILGLVAFALFFLVTHLQFRREYKTALPIDNEYIKLWIKNNATKRNIKILQSDKICAPLTYGIFKPVVLLPKQTDWKDLTRIRYILTHEYVHIKQFDTFTKLLLVSALCIHWFNPFVWLMYILANRDIELSCDETVVKMYGRSMKSAYALTLIGLEEKKNSLTPLINNFSKNSIEERIVAIMKIKKSSTIGIIVAMLVVAVIIIGFATSGVTAARDSEIDSEYKVVQEKTKDKSSVDYTIYEVYGMTYNSKTGEYYYDGKEVRFFYDAVNSAGFTNFNTGKVDIEAKYDKNGKLIGLEYSSKEDYDRRTKKNKVTNNSSDSTEQVAIEDNAQNTLQNMLKAYTQYGVSYNKNEDTWEYNGKQVKTLIDQDNIYCIYSYSSDANGICLSVNRNSDGEISKLEVITDEMMEQMLNSNVPNSDIVVTQEYK